MNKFNNLQLITLLICCCINAVMARKLVRKLKSQHTVKHFENFEIFGSEIETIFVMNVLGYCQLFFSSLMIFMWLLLEAPLLIKVKWRQKIKDYNE